MPWHPDAIKRPITADKGRSPLGAHNRVNLHVAVSEAASLFGFFNVGGQVDSHFYVRRDGTFEQYVNTDDNAFADLEGNDATISIETQGGVTNPNTEPWTPAQAERLAQLYAWCAVQHRIQVKLATSSALGEPSRGLSWHRLGIDGDFPALPSILAGREQRGGGMYYSRSRGKLCPGDTKIGQIPAIFARAQAIIPTLPAPAPMPNVLEDDMIVILNKSNNAAIIVSGGRSAPVVGWDQYVNLTQTLPSLGVSAAQFAAITTAFPSGA
ncbi:N-acetylmuramoyl-L-alanine amidase [Oerskovia enterophila]|uniref:N-acetylmuramoyl-L-alanine amidase n=1 Tax=Oerskovia enterophila TaxID=43678 RepID=A0A163S6W1_9CELL|nr:N-acetylmuramoyl-L-alanine amidase [Oerskovia enterophila]KZM36073.1 N-acetylmuramoyl-L-alanine amidase [Oerskovia enterophila]